MKGTVSASEPLSNFLEEKDCMTLQEESQGMQSEGIEREGDSAETGHLAERVQCMTLHSKRRSPKEVSRGKYGVWRQEQNTRAARLEKQLKARWKIEELIEEQLNRFPSNYNRAVFPARIQDVPKLLMPKWLLPHELTTLAWLGDWRPSCILDLVHALIQSSSFSLSPSSSNSNGVERLLSQLIHEIHIEEAIINEEMVEIQATCIVHLPFSPVRNHRSGATALSCIQAEFKKIERVITKAQQLRFKALELAVKKVLSQSDAAEFLVAFVGIQDVIHQLAAKQKLPKGPAIVPALAFGPA
ncbi:SEED DORMANCY CONTROL PROTEIN [Salix viminalis]|uniref:SEED DORMANCY CONTROL PROTEIN n=1 Tax=Salix viminalis TaxID=40686 RepID=A0A9Q0TPF1_SALVM|nr:SEED DORMANCY CONTROL PROTEIN [Salix viminalis]